MYEILPSGYKIKQSKYYHFSSDAVRLAKFVKHKKDDKLIELCAGSGIIGIYSHSILPYSKLTFVELQKEVASNLENNLLINNICGKVVNKDMKCLTTIDFDYLADVIICNPPFEKIGEKSKSHIQQNQEIAISRHELEINLEQIISLCKKISKEKTKLFMIHKAERMSEVILCLNKYGFEAKKIELLSADDKKCYLFMIEAVFGGKSGVNITIQKS